jgi:hypothetical protein
MAQVTLQGFADAVAVELDGLEDFKANKIPGVLASSVSVGDTLESLQPRGPDPNTLQEGDVAFRIDLDGGRYVECRRNTGDNFTSLVSFDGTFEDSRSWSQHYPYHWTPPATITAVNIDHNYSDRCRVSPDFDLQDECTARAAADEDLQDQIDSLSTNITVNWR